MTASTSGNDLTINLTTVIYGSRSFFLMAFGISSNFNAYASDVETLISGMSFTAPVVNGVNRNQASFPGRQRKHQSTRL